MFSWKKQNPPSQQRAASAAAAAQGSEHYSHLIAQGLKLASEDVDENNDYMDEDGDGDLDDMDLDDPDLLAELQGLTGEAPASQKSKAMPQSAAAPAVAAAPTVPTTPSKHMPVSISKSTPTAAKAAPLPAVQRDTSSQPPPANSALDGLGVDMAAIMDDGDEDEEVDLTEDDWNDPHFMAQLQSLGGGPPQGTTENQIVQQSTPMQTDATPVREETLGQTLDARSQTSQSNHEPTFPTSSSSASVPAFTRKPSSTTSSMIAIPPCDNPYGDDQDDKESVTTSRTDDVKSSPTSTKKRLEDVPKLNHADLLNLLKTRNTQYKKAALDEKRSGNTAVALERIKTFKTIEKYIRLIEEGGFLDLELYPVPEAPPATTTTPAVAIQAAATGKASIAPVTKEAVAPATRHDESKPGVSRGPAIVPSPVEPTTQVSNSIAEASNEDMRSGMKTRGAISGGIEFRQLAADDDFQIVSNSDDDTYDMLESQLESQIKICTSTCGHYYQRGDKQTALEFHKLNKIFKTDLVSLQSYRKHGKKPPAFHFQDVRFEIEVGYYQEIGLNEMALSILRAWDLSHKEVQASDIEAYVSWDLGWPTENMANSGAGKGDTSTVKKTAKPDFGYRKVLNIERTRVFERFVERRKATFEVYHYRGIFRSNYLLGRVQVPLQPLLQHSEIHEILQLVDPNTRRNTGGKIEIKITLQRPLQKPEIVVKEEKWLVIDEFNSGGLGFPSPVNAPTPQSRLANATGSPRTTAGHTTIAAKVTRAPAPVASSSPMPSSPAPARPSPARPSPVGGGAASALHTSGQASTLVRPPNTSNVAVAAAQPALGSSKQPEEAEDEAKEKALDELNSVELLVSTGVLDAEIEAAQDQIHNARAVGNSEAEDDFQDRVTQLEVKKKMLELQVQTGQLTIDGYCKAVYARLEKDKQLALLLNRLGLRTEAAKAMKRFKAMTMEMKEIEAAMAAQGDDEE
ncbi:Coiled-coil and C2 domain-containing protein 1B [Podila humilis]|nr:Coiled-coil and C2 domain-containing protein 1B [Podila humilis]